VLLRVEEIIAAAERLLTTAAPGDAFFAYLVGQATTNRGLAEALGGGGFDVESAAARTGHDLDGVEQRLLGAAQRAGAVRDDVTRADVKALLGACVAAPDPTRMIAIVTAGLRP
jgi:transcriptional regulator SbtR-like protein